MSEKTHQTHIIERDFDKKPFEQIDMSIMDDSETTFIFKRLEEIPLKFWQITPRFRRTDEVWKSRGGDFTVVEFEHIIVK